MRPFLIFLATVIVLLVGLYQFRYELGWQMLFMMKPPGAFDLDAAGPAPDYANADAWISRGAPSSRGAAVFYIHPTTFLKGETWNQPLEASKTDTFLERLAPQQMEVFKDWPVFAPRYRQAAFYAFFDRSGSRMAAVQLASNDVVTAFRQFAAEHDGPIIIAGHSQGAYHAIALVEALTGDPLLDRIAVVYAIGYPIPDHYLEHHTALKNCETAEETGCVLSFNARDKNAYIPGALDRLPLPSGEETHEPIACWNPSAEDSVVQGACGENGWLYVDTPPKEYRDFLFSRGWYHTVELKLFSNSFSRDAAQRGALMAQ